MKITLDMIPPSAQECCNLMRNENARYGVFLDLDNANKEYYLATRDVNKHTNALKEFFGVLSTDLIKDRYIDLIRQKGYFHLLGRTPSGAISLGADVRENILASCEDETIVAVTKLYNMIEKAKRRVSGVNASTGFNIIKLPVFDGDYIMNIDFPDYSKDFHRMAKCTPDYQPQISGRYTANSPAIGNFNKSYKHKLITVPYGWELWEVDSGQIEPRINFSIIIPDKQIQALINLYNDAYYGLLHYSNFLTDEERKSGTTDFKPFTIDEEKEKLRARLKPYTNGVLYGKQSNPDNDPILDNYIKYVGKHPLRLKYIETMKKKILNGESYVITPFGSKINLFDNNPTMEDAINKNSINYLSQATAADLHRIALFNVYDKVHTLGRKSFIVKTVHDSIAVAVHKEDKDVLMPYLQDCVAYEVPGWINIPCKGEFV